MKARNIADRLNEYQNEWDRYEIMNPFRLGGIAEETEVVGIQ